jgi:ribosome-associated translation inhibitor RaiA
MKIIIENQLELPNKFFRYIKWKLHNLQEKFKKLTYANVHIKSLSTKPNLFELVIKLGVKGKDIVIKRRAEDLMSLINSVHKIAHMKLAEIHR